MRHRIRRLAGPLHLSSWHTSGSSSHWLGPAWELERLGGGEVCATRSSARERRSRGALRRRAACFLGAHSAPKLRAAARPRGSSPRPAPFRGGSSLDRRGITGWLAEKYDDLDFHVGGDYPEGLPEEHGWTHIGAFLIWAIERGLYSREWVDGYPAFAEAVSRISSRSIEPSELMDLCEGKLMSNMLNAEGNAFAAASYERYLEVFESTARAEVNRSFFRRVGVGARSAYEIDPGWATYDLLRRRLDELYREWRER
jgi:hypothetical protein